MENSPLGVVAGGFHARRPGARLALALTLIPAASSVAGGLEDMAEYKIIPSLEGYSVEVRAPGSFSVHDRVPERGSRSRMDCGAKDLRR